jgi:disulfide bond formation protein DsbB
MWERHLNALMAVILSGVISGALAIQFFLHEHPCPLCLLQRLGMLGIAMGALFNVKFGPQKMHYGLSLFAALSGGFVAARQIALHVCPGFPKFGIPVWGLSLYTWSFIVFISSVLYIAALLVIFNRKPIGNPTTKLNWWGYTAFGLVFIVALINIFTTLWQCGIGPCRDV